MNFIFDHIAVLSFLFFVGIVFFILYMVRYSKLRKLHTLTISVSDEDVLRFNRNLAFRYELPVDFLSPDLAGMDTCFKLKSSKDGTSSGDIFLGVAIIPKTEIYKKDYQEVEIIKARSMWWMY